MYRAIYEQALAFIRSRTIVSKSRIPTHVTRVALVQTLATIVSFPLVIALGMLLGWHIYLMIHNKTTIEYHEGVRSKWKKQNRAVAGRHVYDLGLCPNLQAVLGSQARPHVEEVSIVRLDKLRSHAAGVLVRPWLLC